MTDSQKNTIRDHYLNLLWKRHDAAEMGAECTVEQMADIDWEIAMCRAQADVDDIDLGAVDLVFEAALALSADDDPYLLVGCDDCGRSLDRNGECGYCEKQRERARDMAQEMEVD